MRSSRAGFTRSPLTCTRPPATAWAASARERNSRAANSHRSMRAAPGWVAGSGRDMGVEYNLTMNEGVLERLRGELAGLREQGLYKNERVLTGPQGAVVRAGAREVINLCANNYLGLANHPAVRAAAQRSLEEFGYGMASVRFICGTQQTHKALEQRLARFLGTEDVILYSSCFEDRKSVV